jgi:predicted GIY-YIG superfamily endonuclease
MTSTGLVYVLRLQGGHYYVGFTRNFDDRIVAHMTGNGAVWTQLHPVEQIELTVPGNEAVETAKTLEYMARYGVDKVRGGPWVQTELQNPPLDLLRTNSQRCYGCGQDGHMVNQCPRKFTNQYSAPVQQQIYQDDDDFCVRCGRDGHDIEDCYTKVTIDGEYLGNRSCCFRCGRDSHWAQDCYAKTDKWGYKI